MNDSICIQYMLLIVCVYYFFHINIYQYHLINHVYSYSEFWHLHAQIPCGPSHHAFVFCFSTLFCPKADLVFLPLFCLYVVSALNSRTHHSYQQADEILAFSLCGRCEITEEMHSRCFSLSLSLSLYSTYCCFLHQPHSSLLHTHAQFSLTSVTSPFYKVPLRPFLNRDDKVLFLFFFFWLRVIWKWHKLNLKPRARKEVPIEIDASVVVDNQDVWGEREGEDETQRERARCRGCRL